MFNHLNLSIPILGETLTKNSRSTSSQCVMLWACRSAIFCEESWCWWKKKSYLFQIFLFQCKGVIHSLTPWGLEFTYVSSDTVQGLTDTDLHIWPCQFDHSLLQWARSKCTKQVQPLDSDFLVYYKCFTFLFIIVSQHTHQVSHLHYAITVRNYGELLLPPWLNSILRLHSILRICF